MSSGNHLADQGEAEYNKRGLCPDCKRDLIQAEENEDGIFLCQCGYEFEANEKEIKKHGKRRTNHGRINTDTEAE